MCYFQNNTVESTEEEIFNCDNICELNVRSLKDWAKSILFECEELVEDGDHENAQYILTLILLILKSLEMFPLWSNVMCKTFNFPSNLASSAASEADFNNTKNRVFKELPCSVDDFVQCHIDSLDGAMILHESKETESIDNLQTVNNTSCSVIKECFSKNKNLKKK